MYNQEVKILLRTMLVGAIVVANILLLFVYIQIQNATRITETDRSLYIPYLFQSVIFGLLIGALLGLVIRGIITYRKKRKLEPLIVKYAIKGGIIFSVIVTILYSLTISNFFNLYIGQLINVWLFGFVIGAYLGIGIWFIKWLWKDAVTEGKFLHHEIFDHNAKSPHWPRIVLLLSIAALGYGLGLISLYPTILRLNKTLTLYNSITQNIQPEVSSPVNKVNINNMVYKNSLLGMQITLPVGWYSRTQTFIPVNELSNYNYGTFLINLTNYQPQNAGLPDITPIPGHQDISLLIWGADPNKTIEQQLSYITPQQTPKKVTISGVDGIKVVSTNIFYNTNNQTYNIKEIRYLLKNKNIIYEFSASELESDNPSFTEFDQFVNSISFN